MEVNYSERNGHVSVTKEPWARLLPSFYRVFFFASTVFFNGSCSLFGSFFVLDL